MSPTRPSFGNNPWKPGPTYSVIRCDNVPAICFCSLSSCFWLSCLLVSAMQARPVTLTWAYYPQRPCYPHLSVLPSNLAAPARSHKPPFKEGAYESARLLICFWSSGCCTSLEIHSSNLRQPIDKTSTCIDFPEAVSCTMPKQAVGHIWCKAAWGFIVWELPNSPRMA